MVFPIHLTRSRLAIALCLGMAPPSAWTQAADWDCAPGKNNQWVCSTKKAPAQGAESEPATAPETPPRAAKPVEPAPAPREIARPTEPSRPEPPAVAEEPESRPEPAPLAKTPPRSAPPVEVEEPVRPEIPAVAEEPASRPEPPPQAKTPPRYEPVQPARPEPPAVAEETPAQPEPPVQPKTPPRYEPVTPAPAPARVEAAPVQPQAPQPVAKAAPVNPPAAPTPAVVPGNLRRIPEALRAAPAANANPAQQAASKPRQPGWTCMPGEGEEVSDQGWDCSLEGPDPRGVARVVDEQSGQTENWAEATTITREDERRLQRLHSLLPVDPWKNACAGRPQLTPMSEFILSPQDKLAREKDPLRIQSNYFEMMDGEIANFSGGVEMVQADQKLWGDFVTRDVKTNAFNAHGNVVFVQKGLTLSADTGFMDSDTGRGVFRNSQFLLPAVPARGASRLTHLDSSTLSRYETVTYTTCPNGNQDWLLHTSDLKINKETGTGTARNAWFEFKDVPVFYTPYMTFPTDQRRQSGFLSPSLGYNRYAGVNFSTPYYFNLAPNYDYTFMPRYFSNRGIQLKNQFRYLNEMTRGLVELDVVPHDDLTGTTRGQVAVVNDTRFTQNLTGRINANYISDYSYLGQLGSAFNINNRSNIPSVGTLNYQGDNYSVRTQIDYFETIDPTVPKNGRPYFHLPQLAFNYGTGIAGTGLVFQSVAQVDSFQNSGTDITTGQRLKLQPRISYPIQGAAGYITPSFALQNNQYWLQSPEYWAQANNVKAKDSVNFTVPITSIDSGVYFERDFELGSKPLTQTFEPRLFYVYIPYEKQANAPIFDSSAYDYTFYQLFRENRFTGGDRVGDTNQVAMALTTRFIDQTTGRDRLSASIGSAYYLSDRQVTLQGAPSLYQTQKTSNLIADFSALLTENWSFRSGGQWNPDLNQIDRGLVSLNYNDKRNDILNIAYRYRRNQSTLTCQPSMLSTGLNPNPCLDLTDVSLRLPITQGWHLLGRWQYSLIDDLTLQTFVGFQRETCCWKFSLVGYRNINNFQSASGETQANNGVYVQLELKGLTSLGDSIDDFLRYQVSGYRMPEEQLQNY